MHRPANSKKTSPKVPESQKEEFFKSYSKERRGVRYSDQTFVNKLIDEFKFEPKQRQIFYLVFNYACNFENNKKITKEEWFNALRFFECSDKKSLKSNSHIASTLFNNESKFEEMLAWYFRCYKNKTNQLFESTTKPVTLWCWAN